MRWLALLIMLCTQAAYAKEAPMQITNVHHAIASQKVWLNTSRALAPEDLKGRIILLDFWTLGCINCIDVIPDIHYLEQTFGSNLTVIGVHSAKFKNERDTENIRSAILRYHLEHPVVNDFDFSIWKKFGVRAWPTFILINPLGTIDKVYEGEGHREALAADINRLKQKYANRFTTSPLPIALEKNKTPVSILNFPGKVAVYPMYAGKPDPLLVSDSGNNRILLVDTGVLSAGKIIDQIGSGKQGFKDGTFETAEFNHPLGTAFPRDGTSALIYIADTRNHALRVANVKTRTVTTIAGTGQQGAVRRPENSPALTTALSSPWDVAFWPDDSHLAIAMAGMHQLWSYDVNAKTLSLLAGSGQESINDGKLPSNSLSQPSGLSVFGDTLYFTDAETSSLRALNKEGSITTLIGTGLFDFGYQEGIRADALMQHALGLVAGKDDIYITDTYNHSIRRYNIRRAQLLDFAGHNERGSTDGSLGEATFNEPGGIAKLANVFYIADTNNHRIRTIDTMTQKVGKLEVLPESTPSIQMNTDLPNLKNFSFSVAAGAPIDVTLTLKPGWHIHKEAASTLSLFSTQADSSLAHFDMDVLRTSHFTLPALARSVYHLRGIIYYCEDKTGVLCMIKSFDATLTPDGTDTKIALPVN